MMFRSLLLDWQINWGNAYAEIVRIGSRVEALWPIHPSRVRAMRDTDTKELYYEIRNNDGGNSEIAYRDMLHVPSMVSDDGITGKGVVRCARESIGFGLAVEQQGAAYFANGTRPSVVIIGGKFKGTSDEAREFYRKTWAEVHAGPANSGRPAMLPEGATLEKLGFPPEDSQFLETREFNVTDIARWYGVPPHMIGDLKRATFSNIEHLAIEFVQYSLIPWLNLWEAEAKRKLLLPAERQNHFFKHNVEGLLRGDSKSRSEFYRELFGIGVLSINEIRDTEDMNPIAEDVRLVPLNMTTPENAGQEKPEPPPQSPNTEEAALQAIAEKRATSQRWFSESVERMVRVECNEARRASRKGGKAFFAWINSYYDSFAGKLVSAVCQAAKACEIDAERFAQEHSEESKDLLLKAAECAENNLVQSVESVVSVWTDRIPRNSYDYAKP